MWVISSTAPNLKIMFTILMYNTLCTYVLYCIKLIQFNSWNLPTLFSFKLGVRVTSIDNLAVISSLNIKSNVFQFHKIYKVRLFLL